MRDAEAAAGGSGTSGNRTLSNNQPQFYGRPVRTGEWRYTEWDGGKRGAELCDEVRDPAENNNRANLTEFAAVRRKMRELLHGGDKCYFTEAFPASEIPC